MLYGEGDLHRSPSSCCAPVHIDSLGAHTHQTLGYFNTGIEDRVDLLSNIMQYFGKTTAGPGTGIAEGEFRNELSFAHPSPFNPVARITYSVKEAGQVTIEVYNVAGKVVRTLLDTQVEVGATGHVDWDGRARSGARGALSCEMKWYRWGRRTWFSPRQSKW